MTVADGAPDALSAPQAAALPYGLPDDPGQELMPVAVPEQAAKAGVPVKIEALKQTRVGDVWTLEGKVVIDYKGYVIRADKIVYNQATSEVEADGHLQVTGGPYDVLIEATHGQMRLNAHTARFYNVTGSEGVRSLGRAAVYSTVNPLLFSARVLLENGEGNYKIVDGSITNCRLPHPDWRILARQIELDNRVASTSNARFDFLGVPIFYLPYLRHPASENGRESGLLIPVISTGSSIRGFTFGEQVYWAINRSMDMVVGSEYFSKRGWAPNGDFRYKGLGLDHLIVHWNALLDRGVEQPVGVAAPAPADRGVHELPDAPGLSLFDESAGEPSGSTAQPASRTGSSGLPVFAGMVRVNQGGVDVGAEGRKDFTPATRLAGAAEYLSSYTYRLVFNDNYTQATSSQVTSVVGLTHNHNGRVLSGSLERFQSFASTANGDEVKVLHLPSARYDVLARPLWNSPFYWWFSSSAGFLNRSEPDFHARNVGRFDIYPHLSLPLSAGGWSLVPEFALRDTHYTISQTPDLTGANGGIPYISHDPLVRTDLEASIDIRPPALERDFTLPFGHRVLRHVIEPEITYNYVGGIGAKARNVLLFDTTDIAANTNQVGYSLTQHFYLKPAGDRSCGAKDGGGDADGGASGPSRQLNQMDRLNQAGKSDQADQANQADHAVNCAAREWATWQIAQDFYFDPNFGGALIPGRRNVFNAALDLTPVAFLTSPRNISPIVSRLRFNAISNLRFEWDLDYDPKAGQLDADNLFAGYSWGRTTLGVEHALLNAVDENTGTSSTTLKSQQLHPFLAIGKPNGEGFNLAINGGYDFVIHQVQYAGMQAAYNWNCCGLTLGYRRFELGSEGTVSRDETQWLYSFTLANFGGVGDIRRANSVFRDPSLPSAY
ncbi:MAG: LPS-assembly protein LptD [Terracidiphilus sp.]